VNNVELPLEFQLRMGLTPALSYQQNVKREAVRWRFTCEAMAES
jgi:hypothetical protein